MASVKLEGARVVENGPSMASNNERHYMFSSGNSRNGVPDKDGVKQRGPDTDLSKSYRSARSGSSNYPSNRSGDAASQLPIWYHWGVLTIAILSVSIILIIIG